MSKDDRIVFGGIDTHRDVHMAAVVDSTGRVLGTAPFVADTAGYCWRSLNFPSLDH